MLTSAEGPDQQGPVDTSDWIFCFCLEMRLTGCPRLCLSRPVRAV